MSYQTEPTKHLSRSRLSSLRSRIRRIHVIIAGSVLAVLVAGGVAWAVVGNQSNNPSSHPGSDPQACCYPVPTWSAASGRPGRDNPEARAGNQVLVGMPTHLSAERQGDTVVLQWADNTNNEDGFAVFVTQGQTSLQVVVPGGTTRYEYATGGRDTPTCFTVVPFTWTSPVVDHPTRGWECTNRNRA
jgi:hypothetical protein